jgi:hypothetical protein
VVKLNDPPFGRFGGAIPDLVKNPEKLAFMNDWNGSSTLSEHETLIARYLRDSRKREALAWLKGGAGEKRLIGECKTKQNSLALVKTLYAMGAEKVIAVHIRSTPPAKGQRTGRLVIKLPPSAAQRSAIFDWCDAQGDSLAYTPKPDHGETYMFLLLE